MVSLICGIRMGKKSDFIETENRMVVARGLGAGEWGAISQRVQIFRCKKSKF